MVLVRRFFTAHFVKNIVTATGGIHFQVDIQLCPKNLVEISRSVIMVFLCDLIVHLSLKYVHIELRPEA